MSIVTLKISQDVAVKLCQKKASEANKVNSDLVNVFTNHFISTIPEDELKAFEKDPDDFKRSNIVHVCSDVLDVDFLYLNRELPSTGKKITLPTELESEILDLHTRKEKFVKDYGILFNQVIEVLLNLRTYNAIKSEFPEAYYLLPVQNASLKFFERKELLKLVKSKLK